MEIETRVCFGSNSIKISSLVDALAEAIGRCGLSLEWAPDTDPVYVDWHGFGSMGSWVHCSDPPTARQLAREIAAILEKELSLFEASCELTEDDGTLSFQARNVSSEGKIMPMAVTALDGENLESLTAGYVRDRLDQILVALTCCDANPAVSNSFRVYPCGLTVPDVKWDRSEAQADVVQETVSEIQASVSAVLSREDATTFEFEIQTSAGYVSTIYVNAAERKEIEDSLDENDRAKIAMPSVHGPLLEGDGP